MALSGASLADSTFGTLLELEGGEIGEKGRDNACFEGGKVSLPHLDIRSMALSLHINVV